MASYLYIAEKAYGKCCQCNNLKGHHILIEQKISVIKILPMRASGEIGENFLHNREHATTPVQLSFQISHSIAHYIYLESAKQ